MSGANDLTVVAQWVADAAALADGTGDGDGVPAGATDDADADLVSFAVRFVGGRTEADHLEGDDSAILG